MKLIAKEIVLTANVGRVRDLEKMALGGRLVAAGRLTQSRLETEELLERRDVPFELARQ